MSSNLLLESDNGNYQINLSDEEIDARLRPQLDRILIASDTDRLHIPADDGPTDEDGRVVEPACQHSDDQYRTSYRNRPLDVYPPGYYPFCRRCAAMVAGGFANTDVTIDDQ